MVKNPSDEKLLDRNARLACDFHSHKLLMYRNYREKVLSTVYFTSSYVAGISKLFIVLHLFTYLFIYLFIFFHLFSFIFVAFDTWDR